MTHPATEDIEVEVVAIDDLTPVVPNPKDSPPDAGADSGERQDWRQWQGRVKRLDSRWWPLWALLGIIALALILTVGIVIGVIYLVVRAVRGIFRAVFG